MEGLQIGRIVHYVAYGTPEEGEYEAGAHRAAIITEILVDGLASLAVLNPTGIHWNTSNYSEAYEPGTWHWPEKK